MDRRKFLKTASGAAVAAVLPAPALVKVAASKAAIDSACRWKTGMFINVDDGIRRAVLQVIVMEEDGSPAIISRQIASYDEFTGRKAESRVVLQADKFAISKSGSK